MIEDILKERVMVLDGSMGALIQQRGLNGEVHGNNDMLVITNPDAIRQIHREYLEAGADIIETNTFNAQRISQAEYHTEQYIKEINRRAAQLAREEANRMTALTPDKPRFVAGSIGPTGKTASMSPNVDDPAMRAVTYDELFEAYREQIGALMEGGVDVLLIETIFDTLNAKATVMAAESVFEDKGRRLPIMLSITIADAAGRMLTGQSIEAFVATVMHFHPLSIGINCSFGPAQLRPFIKQLRKAAPCYVSAYPNAGLPNALGEYDETPESMAAYMRTLVSEGLVDIVGGCCGTTPEHIRVLSRECQSAAHQRKDTLKVAWLAGIDAFTPMEGTFINVGERCNVAGSRKFLRLINEKQYDEALTIARKQVRDGAMLLDINMDDGMLDAKAEMTHFLNLMASDPEVAKVPWMVDSSKFDVIEAALKCIQGKAVVNSISLKEGEEEFLRRARIISSYGAAMVVMAFDEKGQATTFNRKIEVCARAYKLLTEQAGVNPNDIIFDPNILTIATGMKEHDRYALDFIEATEWIKHNLPGAKVSGGVSNLSFSFRGNNYLREAMHSVFLYHAIAAGMDMAIVNPASKVQYADIPSDLLTALEDVILCRKDNAVETLVETAAKYSGKKVETAADDSAERSAMPLEERIIAALQRGDSEHLDEDMWEALASYPTPQSIIEGPLMKGMTLVGDLFGSGKMFLPQVVKSARTMKQAVEIVMGEMTMQQNCTERQPGEPASGTPKPKFLLATVKGDVHDIGKNITGVVLACNNFDVTDLGVMVEASEIVKVAKEKSVDFIGLSGLITPSLDEMCNVAAELKKAGITVPLFIGGATTSALHTAVKIAPLYDGAVFHVKDAAQNPIIAMQLLGSERDCTIAVLKTEQERLRQTMRQTQNAETTDNSMCPKIDWSNEPTDTPTYIGTRTYRNIQVAEVRPYINWTYFYTLWRVSPDTPEATAIQQEAEEVINQLVKEHATLQAAVGFYSAYGTSHSIVVECGHSNGCPCCGGKPVEISTPRQARPNRQGVCLSLCDYVAPEGHGDHIGAFAITISKEILDRLETLKAEGNDYDSLLLQSVCDRLTEAASEWMHHKVRKELWGYAPDEIADTRRFYKADYRGIRPAVGYPSLPDQKEIFNINKLLNLKQIGIRLTENGAMYPQSSVCGLYLASPRAEYFII